MGSICVSPRMLWLKLKVAGEKIVTVGGYGPGMERSENERCILRVF